MLKWRKVCGGKKCVAVKNVKAVKCYNQFMLKYEHLNKSKERAHIPIACPVFK